MGGEGCLLKWVVKIATKFLKTADIVRLSKATEPVDPFKKIHAALGHRQVKAFSKNSQSTFLGENG